MAVMVPVMMPAAGGTEKARWHVPVVLGLMAVFAALRLIGLSDLPLGNDESLTAYFAALDYGELTPFINLYDMHPPFYYAYIRLFSVFGDGPFAIRIGAALTSILALPALYLAGRWIGAPGRTGPDPAAGLAVLVLGGLSSASIAWAQNARPYGMMFLTLALAFAAIGWLLQNRAAMQAPFWRAAARPALPGLAGLVLGLAGLLWSHNVGVLYTAAMAAALVAVWLVSFRASAGAFINLAAAGLAVLLIWAPHLSVLLHQWGAVAENFWIPRPTLPGLVLLLLNSLGDADNARALRPDEMLYALILFSGAGWACLLALWKRDWGWLVLTPLMLGLALALVIGVTYLSRPILLARTAYPLAAPFLILAGTGLAALPGRRAGQAVLALAAALAAVSVWDGRAHRSAEEPWPDLIASIIAQSDGRPTVLTVPNSAAIPLSYNLRQTGGDMAVHGIPGAYPAESPTGQYPTGWRGVPAVSPAGLAAAQEVLDAAPGSAWLLLRAYWIFDPDALLRPYFDARYCYETLFLPDNPYLFALKLVPRDTLASTTCVEFDPDPYYPYTKTGPGTLRLTGPD